MGLKRLKKPPLVEVILEVRWELQDGPVPDTKTDPNYSLLPGRLYERVSAEYPYHEQLPQASIPDEISAYVVKHRFRREKAGWPLIQVGPGIFTINHTEKYTTFDDFCPLIVSAVNWLFEVYPQSGSLEISNLLLRYIDATEFDYKKEDVQEFLRDKMGVPLVLPEKLFGRSGVEKSARNLIWSASFPCSRPKGLATLKFATGLRKGRPAIIWEQIVGSAHEDVPEMPTGFETWIKDAHAVTESWFLSLIEGDLQREFNNG